MRQDRRLNGWVLLGSIIQIIASIIALVAGAGLAVIGFLDKDKLAKLTDLTIFTGHLSDLQDKFLNKHLMDKYLYLFLGIVVAVIALIALILAIVSLVYAKKRRVVRHRVALLVFSLIPLAIVGGVAYYYILKYKTITDNIKYVAYGLMGAFGVPALFNILGVLFGRSEKFMSNDNGKYAFNNASARNTRTGANNAKPAQMQYPAQANQGEYVPMNQERPVQPQAPVGQATARPVQPMQRPAQPGMRPSQPMARPGQPMQRPAQPGVRPGQPMQRPVQPGIRPGQPMQRPAQPGAQPAQPQMRAQRFCNKCGKMLNPNETFCSLCGTKINK